jgi:hypothetical protein
VLKRTDVGDEAIEQPSPKPRAPLADICLQIKTLQQLRRNCIKAQGRCDRSVEAHLTVILGRYDQSMEAMARLAIFKAAASLRIKIEKIGEDWKDGEYHPQVDRVVPIVLDSARSRAPWDRERRVVEGEMRILAKQLPVWAGFCADIKGFGELGLAIVIGEAGRPLGDYSTVSKLWKRLGLGLVQDGGGWVRQQRRVGTDKGTTHGYSPARRAEIWAMFSDTMLKHQWRGARCLECEKAAALCKCEVPDIIPAHAIGTYGVEYGRKKEEYMKRDRIEWPLARCDAAARRYMSKCVIRDLWIAWRRVQRMHDAHGDADSSPLLFAA